MDQNERRNYLIQKLLEEQPAYQDLQIPAGEEDQKRLLRSLMNVRPPRPVSERFLAVQDEYLTEEVKKKGIIDSDSLPVSPEDPRLVLWRGDITTLKIDAIVNAANSQMTGCYIPGHACIDNCIHTYAGVQLRYDCFQKMQKQGFGTIVNTASIGGYKMAPGFAA